MILVVFILLGLALRRLGGMSIRDIERVRVRGERALIVILAAQLVLPSLPLGDGAGSIAYVIWLLSFPALIVICWLNRRAPGMAVIGVGLLLNFVVIGINGGMPVMPSAVKAAADMSREVAIPRGDFVHVLGGEKTRLAVLADTIPLQFGPLFKAVPSAGDCLLFVGLLAFVSSAGRRQRLPQSSLQNMDS